MQMASWEVLFLSDNSKECDAAIAAGMRSLIVDRPGNAPLLEWDGDKLSVVTSFQDVHVDLAETGEQSVSLPTGAQE